MIRTLKLPFTFDAAAIRRDAEAFAEHEWTPHFNTFQFEGDWSGIALTAPEGAHAARLLYPDPTAENFVPTPAMERCPAVGKVLEAFECRTESVRFLRLAAGSVIREHRDYKLAVEEGVARIHIPIKTNPKVEFFIDGTQVLMGEGEAWYLNFNLQHRVTNGGDAPRIHLVIDCVVNDWLRQYFPAEVQVQ